MIQVFRSPVRSGLFILSFVFLTSCDWGRNPFAAKPVVQVNEHTLSAKEFSNQLARKLKNFDALAAKDPNNVSRAKEDIIRVFILQSLSLDYANNNSIKIDDAELEKELNNFRSSYPDDLSFRRVLAEENMSVSEWKEELRQTLLYKKIFKKISAKIQTPSDSEIQRHFEDHKTLYKRQERIYLRQIISDDLSKAQSIREELKKKDFSDLAKKYSVSPESKNGGLVGWVEKGSVDIFDKAFTLPIGGMSQVLESPYGFHIFKVERRQPAGYAAVADVKEEIIQSLMGKRQQAEFSSWLDQQIRASKVLKDQDLISAISVETRGQK